MKSNIKPIYAYVPLEVHDYLDKIRVELGMNKSDFVYFMIKVAENCFSMEDLDALARTFIFDPAAMPKINLETQKT